MAQTKGAIGYVEYAYALQNKMTTVKMINKDGKAVDANSASFQAAAANADWAKSDNYYVVLTNQPGAGSWPIAGATFILMYKQPQDPARSAAALKFFDWAYTKGSKAAEELNYVPLPPEVIAQIEKTWAEIKGPDGKPVFSIECSSSDRCAIRESSQSDIQGGGPGHPAGSRRSLKR